MDILGQLVCEVSTRATRMQTAQYYTYKRPHTPGSSMSLCCISSIWECHSKGELNTRGVRSKQWGRSQGVPVAVTRFTLKTCATKIWYNSLGSSTSPRLWIRVMTFDTYRRVLTPTCLWYNDSVVLRVLSNMWLSNGYFYRPNYLLTTYWNEKYWRFNTYSLYIS